MKEHRQTTLGEYHQDFPSPHGDVTEYHGTTDAPGVAARGLEGKVMSRHRAVRPPADLEDRPVVYTTSDKEKAREWAEQRAKTLGTDPANVGVFGVRGGDLESTEQEDPRSQFRGATTRVHSPSIPRERLTVVKQQGQEPSFATRQVEEAPPETDESLDTDTGVSMEENDSCCEQAKANFKNTIISMLDDYYSVGDISLEEAVARRFLSAEYADIVKMDCDGFRAGLESYYPDINEPERSWMDGEYVVHKVLQEWDACAGQQFSGDMFTAGHGSAGILVKHAESPEAKRHKHAYDKKYMDTPERIKYREDLIAERRKRGIYGRGGPDMSHTKEGTLVAESPHANRARHFKERGTLKSVGVCKSDRPWDALVEGRQGFGEEADDFAFMPFTATEEGLEGPEYDRRAAHYIPQYDMVNVGPGFAWNMARGLAGRTTDDPRMKVMHDNLFYLNRDEMEAYKEANREKAERIFAESPGEVFSRVTGHEYGHAVTMDEVMDFLRERGLLEEEKYADHPTRTFATEYPAYTTQYPESGYLAAKNALKQVLTQVSRSTQKKRDQAKRAAGLQPDFSFGPNDISPETRQRVRDELPPHLRSLQHVVTQAQRAGPTLAEQEQAYREMMGARARDPMLRQQTLTPSQWPGRIAVARRELKTRNR